MGRYLLCLPIHVDNLPFYRLKNIEGDDPPSFLDFIEDQLPLSLCEKLLILNCDYPFRRLRRLTFRDQKSKLLAAITHDRKSVPWTTNYFTMELYFALRQLLRVNPEGFSTSHLHREVLGSLDPYRSYVPVLIDLSNHSSGDIWLCRQYTSQQTIKSAAEPWKRFPDTRQDFYSGTPISKFPLYSSNDIEEYR